LLVAGVVGIGLLLSGCAEKAPQDTLRPEGKFAKQIDNLFRWPFWIAVAVFVIVEGLLLFAAVRYRHREGREDAPKQIHGNFKLETTLTALPLVILAVIAVPTVGTIFSLADRPPNALTVDVIGHQWWWEYKYPGGVTTATELVIPVGRPVYLRMTSVDVIHSFWIPKLNGKRDVIPGRLQTSKVQADQPGTYLGQCTEFCGASHANMRNRAIAMTPAGFDRWLAEQQATPATPAASSAAGAGLTLFNSKGCAGCHTIDGVSKGKIGPNLSHFWSRTTFAGGIFKTDEPDVAAWLRDPPGEKPGSIMPNLHLKEDEIANLVAYLKTLK
jgi:cytochrome c oxidase subunit 2